MLFMATKIPARKRDDVTSQKRDDGAPPQTGSPARFKGRRRSVAKFRERELARALRAAKRAGGVARVQLNLDGSIQMILAGQDHPAAPIGNELDEWMAKKHAHETEGH
jgi:hypothetical protein